MENNDNGVFIVGATSNNEIEDGTSAGSNTMAFNGKDGMQIFDTTSTGNEVSHNSIFSNVGLGIDLIGPGEIFTSNIPTPNDGDIQNTPQVDPDSDTGANNLQNKPVLTSAATSSTTTTVKGTLNSAPGVSFSIEFYANPSGADEGQRFIGAQSVSTNASGDATFSFQPQSKVAAGQNITATATNGSTRDTS